VHFFFEGGGDETQVYLTAYFRFCKKAFSTSHGTESRSCAISKIFPIAPDCGKAHIPLYIQFSGEPSLASPGLCRQPTLLTLSWRDNHSVNTENYAVLSVYISIHSSYLLHVPYL